MTATPFFVGCTDVNTGNNSLCYSCVNFTAGKFQIYANRGSVVDAVWGHWIAFCS